MEILESKTRLTYPVYACDFDPQDAGRLICGGGGGSSRTGVGNKITLLTIPNQDAIVSHTSEIELSKEEDNVTCLVAGQRKGRSTLVYAGVNSSPEDQKKGKNEHFRVFGVDQVSKTKSAIPPKIAELVRTSLFSTNDVDTYQRVVRLSPLYEGSPQLGACATSLSKSAQIVLFDVSASGAPGPKVRGKLELTREAMDLDIIQTGPDQFELAYCDDYELLTMKVGKGSQSDDPQIAFTLTADEAAGATTRPSFRSIRWLTPSFILAAANLPKRTGVVLLGFRLIDGRARLSVSVKLPKTVAQTTGMAVRNLSPLATPSAKQGDAQFVVAVTGIDNSISLYTLEHQSVSGIDVIANLHPFTTLKSVHDLQITCLAFSHFHAPLKTTSRSQYLKLASASFGNTVSVAHIPLRKVMDKSSASARRAGPPRPPRYVVALKSRGPSGMSLYLFIAVGFALLALALQTVLEIKGLTPPAIGARRFTPASWHADGPRAPKTLLPEMLARHQGSGRPILVLDSDNKDGSGSGSGSSPGGAAVEVVTHDEFAHGPAVAWEELPAEQRAAWREKLKRAGHWGEEMGETLFKGVLFSEIAGLMAGLVN